MMNLGALDLSLFPDDDPWAWGASSNVNSISPTVGFADTAVSTSIETGIPGFTSAVESGSWGNSVLEIISAGLQAWNLSQQQRAFLEVNRDRLAQGLAPITIDQLAPSASVAVGVNQDTQRMVYILGGGALLVLASMALRKR